MINNFFKEYKIYLIFFSLFLLIYLLNFEAYTFREGTDFRVRYEYYGVKIINDILNLDFSSNVFLFGQPNHYAFFNSYFIPEIITGVLIYITPNDYIFGVLSNLLNMFLLFCSIKIFFNCLKIKNKDMVVLIFFSFFFIYLANWSWVFWKLADIYFLFIFSLIFYLLTKGIESKKSNYLLFAFFLTCISFITKPQSLAIIPFFLFLSIFLVAIYFQEHRLDSLLALRFEPNFLFQKIILLIMSAVFFAYCFVATVGVWKSANNYAGKKIWSILAKISIVLAFIFYIKDFNKLFW